MLRSIFICALLLISSFSYAKRRELIYDIDKQIVFFDSEDPNFKNSTSKVALSQKEFKNYLKGIGSELHKEELEHKEIESLLSPIYLTFENSETVYYTIENYELFDEDFDYVIVTTEN